MQIKKRKRQKSSKIVGRHLWTILMHCKDKVVRGDVQSNPLDKDDHILPPNGKSIIENTCWYLHQQQRYVLLSSGLNDRIKEKFLLSQKVVRRHFNDRWVSPEVVRLLALLQMVYSGKLQSCLRLRNFQNPLNKDKTVGL